MTNAYLQDKMKALAGAGDTTSSALLGVQLADMFVQNTGPSSSESKSDFDHIIKTVIQRTTPKSHRQMSERLAFSDRISEETALRFAEHEDIAVADPMLRRSPVLSDEALIRIAREKDENYRAAIAGRMKLSHQVTEVLVTYGGDPTLETVSRNEGALWNHRALDKLMRKAPETATVEETVARALRADSSLAKQIRIQLSKELRLRDDEIETDAHGFEMLNKEVESEVRQSITADRIAKVEAMMAQAQIESGETTLSAIIEEQVRSGRFILAVHTMGAAFSLKPEHLLNAIKHESPTPVALLSKAANLSLDTYAELEAARCQHYNYPIGDLEQKKRDAGAVTKDQANELLTIIRARLSGTSAA